LGNFGGPGDAIIGYGTCSVLGACHDTEGNATIEMWASSDSVMVDETVTVFVNVTSWTLSTNRIIGTYLLRSFTDNPTDVPSNDGWRIIVDPNGNKNNYVEKVAGDVGNMTSFRWDLRAPFSSGTYTLYSRVHHGGGTSLWEEDRTGLTFDVFPDVTVKPDLVILEAFSYPGIVAGEQVVLYATVYNSYSEVVDGISVSFLINGVVVSQVNNQTIGGKSIRNATVTWLPSEAGNFTLTAVLDPLNDIEESDETNNEANYSLEVAEPDLKPTPRFDILGFLLIVLVVFVAGIAVISVMRRKEEEEEEEDETD
jgi:hypothetical protein